MADFAFRLTHAAWLDSGVYEDVEADKHATGQALAVVVLSSLAAGIGSVRTGGAAGIIWGTVGALAGWFIWAYLTYLIGTRLLPEPTTEATYGELLRTTGFSSAPGLIRILGLIPLLGAIAFFVAAIWMLAAMVIAVRQALDYKSTWRAIGVCLIGWVIQAVILAVVLAVTGGLGGVQQPA
ncbi:MAG: hypothetical protein GF401_08810 [Chitinivibrionales bacterium]|nr:hypothetical protein [Chitinivibrionales bacterium]